MLLHSNNTFSNKFKNDISKILDELSKTTLKSYVDKVATGPSRGTTQNGNLKSIKDQYQQLLAKF